MYTYGELLDDVNFLSRYGVETGCIGASAFGRLIPYITLNGTGQNTVLVTAAVHAREHVSALFAVKQAYRLFSLPRLACSVCFVPMVNPDGNVLIAEGAEAFGFEKNRLIEMNGGADDFSLWKANAQGVDVNTNFDARWGEGVQNVRTPGAENYIGSAPLSSPEAAALAAFTRKVRPCLTLSYHAKGREIYYAFGQTGQARARDRRIAEEAARITDYRLIEGTMGSAGGYKDWCVSALGIPSLTLELADDAYSHPLPDDSIKEDFARAALLPVQLYRFMAENGYAGV